jgi:hypothetical protein
MQMRGIALPHFTGPDGKDGEVIRNSTELHGKEMKKIEL